MELLSRFSTPLAIAAFLTCLTTGAEAQFEAGLLVGGTAYEGELAPVDRSRHFGQARLALGGFGRYQFSNFVAVRLNYTYLSIEGSDITRPTSMSRNHRFVTEMHEVAAGLDYYFLGTERRLAPYLTVGAGAFYYNPTTDFGGQRFDLRPLGTEGQGNPGFEDPYSEWAFALPLGAGVRFELLPQILLGLEVVGRFTTVDHLDDISREFYVPLDILAELNGPLSAELSYRTDEIGALNRPDGMTRRANPETSDYYLTAQLTMSYRFGQGSTLRRRVGGGGKPIDCPKF